MIPLASEVTKEDPSYRVTIATGMTMGELVEMVSDTLHDSERLAEFSMLLDQAVADLDYSVDLWWKLGRSIRQEVGVDLEEIDEDFHEALLAIPDDGEEVSGG